MRPLFAASFSALFLAALLSGCNRGNIVGYKTVEVPTNTPSGTSTVQVPVYDNKPEDDDTDTTAPAATSSTSATNPSSANATTNPAATQVASTQKHHHRKIIPHTVMVSTPSGAQVPVDFK